MQPPKSRVSWLSLALLSVSLALSSTVPMRAQASEFGSRIVDESSAIDQFQGVSIIIKTFTGAGGGPSNHPYILYYRNTPTLAEPNLYTGTGGITGWSYDTTASGVGALSQNDNGMPLILYSVAPCNLWLARQASFQEWSTTELICSSGGALDLAFDPYGSWPVIAYGGITGGLSDLRVSYFFNSEEWRETIVDNDPNWQPAGARLWAGLLHTGIGYAMNSRVTAAQQLRYATAPHGSAATYTAQFVYQPAEGSILGSFDLAVDSLTEAPHFAFVVIDGTTGTDTLYYADWNGEDWELNTLMTTAGDISSVRAVSDVDGINHVACVVTEADDITHTTVLHASRQPQVTLKGSPHAQCTQCFSIDTVMTWRRGILATHVVDLATNNGPETYVAYDGSICTSETCTPVIMYAQNAPYVAVENKPLAGIPRLAVICQHNPSSDGNIDLRIESTTSREGELELFDCLGRSSVPKRAIALGNGSTAYKWQVGSLHEGVYFVRVRDGLGRSTVSKLIVVK